MRSVKGCLEYIVPIVLLTLMLSACERPLQTDDSTESEAFTDASFATTDVVEQATPITNEAATADNQEEAQAGESSLDSTGDDSELDQDIPDDVETETPESDQAEVNEPTGEAEETPQAEPTVTDVVEATETPVFQEAVEEDATVVPELEGESPGTTEDEPSESDDQAANADVAGEDSSETGAGDEDAASIDETAQSIPRTHTVQASDNLYRIGLEYGISWVAIAEYNNLSFPYFIYAGDVLQIPGGGSVETQEQEAEESAAPTTYVDYSVQFGDTLAKISQQFGVSSEAIIEVNGIINPNLIYAGQTLKIPTTTPESQQSISHVVQWGETLYLISLQYGVQWLAIAEANGIFPPYAVYAGQTLVIPGG